MFLQIDGVSYTYTVFDNIMKIFMINGDNHIPLCEIDYLPSNTIGYIEKHIIMYNTFYKNGINVLKEILNNHIKTLLSFEKQNDEYILICSNDNTQINLNLITGEYQFNFNKGVQNESV